MLSKISACAINIIKEYRLLEASGMCGIGNCSELDNIVWSDYPGHEPQLGMAERKCSRWALLRSHFSGIQIVVIEKR